MTLNYISVKVFCIQDVRRKAGNNLNVEGIYYTLLKGGYQFMNSNIPFIRFYCKRNNENNSMNIMGFVDNIAKDSINNEQLDNVAFQVERKFLLSGVSSVNILFVIFSDNFERDKKLCEGNAKFWIIDTLAHRIVIFENQPDDFDGLKDKLEQTINDVSYAEKNNCKSKNTGIKSFPFVTVVLIILNVIYFLILEKNGSPSDVMYMLKMGAVYHQNVIEKHEYYRLITSMFMHFDFAHLLNNMFGLALLGNEAERFYGKVRYFIIYMISGIGGSFASALYFYLTDGQVISAGASGAIYGIMGALVVKIIEEKRNSSNAVRKMLFVLLLLVMVGQKSENVDNIAHLAGFAIGILTGLLIYKVFGRKEEHINVK